MMNEVTHKDTNGNCEEATTSRNVNHGEASGDLDFNDVCDSPRGTPARLGMAEQRSVRFLEDIEARIEEVEEADADEDKFFTSTARFRPSIQRRSMINHKPKPGIFKRTSTAFVTRGRHVWGIRDRSSSENHKFHGDILDTFSSHAKNCKRKSIDASSKSVADEDDWDEEDNHECGNWLVLALVIVLFIGGCFCLPFRIFAGEDLKVFKTFDASISFQCFATTVAIIPICIGMIWAIRIVMPGNDEEQEDEKHTWYKRLVPSREAILLILCLVLNQATHVVNLVVKEELVDEENEVVEEGFKEIAIFLLHRSLAFSMFGFWITILDLFHNWVHRFADRLEMIVGESNKSKEGRKILRSFCRFGDMATDRAYAIPGGSRSPARVLAEVAGVYCNLGKGTGFFMLFSYMVGIDLYSNLLIFGVTVFFAAVVQALHINDALGNLIPLAFSNSVHLGEIISLSRPGRTPGDHPKALCGFVESITWSHVVIRDFQRKQVFVPHREMETKVLHNWSRRPSKLCQFELTVVPSLGGGAYQSAELSRFVRSWVESHSKIDQNQYTRIAIKLGTENKLLLEVQFYPKVDGFGLSKSRALKAEFTVMIMDVSKRLNLCIIPVDISPKTHWQLDEEESSHVTESTLETEDEETFDFSDLLPSEDLTYRAGIGQKSMGSMKED
jgi:hypothetical protein